MKPLQLHLDDLNVDSFAVDASNSDRGTVHGQIQDFTEGCLTPVIGCDPNTGYEVGCPVDTAFLSECVRCDLETEQYNCTAAGQQGCPAFP